MSDPFAAAAAQGFSAPVNRPVSAPVDPFVGANGVDDPFAVWSDFRGDFTPSPGLEALRGRLVVLIPRSLDANAKDPNDPTGVKIREVYTADLTVLDGGALEFYYTVRADPERGTEEEVKTWTVDSMPATFNGYWVPQWGLVGKLKDAHRMCVPLLGVPTIVATAAERQSGVTAAQATAAFDGWVARGRNGKRPQYSWALADPTPERRQLAVAWWATARDTIAPIAPPA